MNTLVLIVSDLARCPVLMEKIGRLYPADIHEHREVAAAALATAGLILVDLADAREEALVNVREALAAAPRVPSVGLVRPGDRRDRIQAHALGLTRVWSRGRPVRDALRDIESVFGSYATPDLPLETPAATGRSVQAMSAALGECATAAVSETHLPLGQLARAVDHTLAAFRLDGLDAWIAAVQMHHSHTYCHSMLVTGYALAFADALGLSCEERAFLGSAALLHDVGKVYVPLSILDKPGRLSDQEFAVVRQHPVHARTILGMQPNISAEVIDIAVHHHEYLDGSGYPDGLSSHQIGESVRILTICDIYAALIEKRAYKDAYSPRQAYGVLLEMGRKIDQTLLKEFRAVAFEVDKVAAVRRKVGAFG